MPPSITAPAPGTARRLRLATLAVVVGWAVTVLPTVYAPRVLVGVSITLVGLVAIPISSMPAPVVVVARIWFLANIAALVLPVLGTFLEWPNATLLFGAAVALLATLHLAPVAGIRLADELDDPHRRARWAVDLRLAFAGDIALVVTAIAWALNASLGVMPLAALAVMGAGVAAGLYAWACVGVGVGATWVGDWLRSG